MDYSQSPIFFCKIVRIERLQIRAAILVSSVPMGADVGVDIYSCLLLVCYTAVFRVGCVAD